MPIAEENIMKGVRALKQRHTLAFLSAIEKGVGKKLREKDIDIDNMNRKNKELVDRIKQVSVEAQSWHNRAKYNELMVNVLKNNLRQAMAQGADQGKEGCGDSEVDDAASYVDPNNHLGIVPPGGSHAKRKNLKEQMACKACKIKEVSTLLLPCRHLCMCKDCEGFIDVCPICQTVKTASVEVFMS
ncbi:hypothetical protein GIB67_017696 [Kingdonia uniflora]|uniref:RING-type domain-containing protein n=1 Tax=Kingdonia uniflora TaxID=39325 RepID=A0A7J7NAU1_9MAGN|nr:hypothetical protein GIB67_017696 [Kingdonia uniflora]